VATANITNATPLTLFETPHDRSASGGRTRTIDPWVHAVVATPGSAITEADALKILDGAGKPVRGHVLEV
jgi:hypothetical protein